MDKRPHISFTQITQYSACGLKYYYRYVRGIITPATSTLILGRTVHRAIEENYKRKMKTGEDMSLDDLLDNYAGAFHYETERQEVDWQDEKPAEIKDAGAGLVKVFREQISPETQPELVEFPFEIPLTDGVNLKGVIDLVTVEKEIRDTKTSAKSYTENDINANLQLSLYSAVLAGSEDEVHRVGLDVLVKNKTPKAQALRGTRGPEDRRRAMAHVKRVYEAMRAGIYTPCLPDSWVCTPKWCGYYELCHKEL